jgi:hydrogenase maturation protein HypF
VENGITGPAIGAALDGTGYGTDGKVWGSEFMTADYHGFQRRAHLEYLPLPGGNAAIRKPYRTAIGYLYSLFGPEAIRPDLPFLKGIDELEIDLIIRQIDQKLNTPLTSSCGRLFDAVSALLGIRPEVEYEGQAAIELEAIADENETEKFYPFSSEIANGVRIIRVKEILAAILSDIQRSIPSATISARFHNTIARMVVTLCHDLRDETGLCQVALSGGVFQNRRLLNQTVKGLKADGLIPLLHCQVPCNDGGISLGQAVAAASF